MGGLLKVGRSKTQSLTNFLLRSGKEMGYKIIDINGADTEGEFFFCFFFRIVIMHFLHSCRFLEEDGWEN